MSQATPDHTADALFGDLRALAHAPSWASWAALCAMVEEAAARGDAVLTRTWLPYLEGALRRWPDDLRLCPQRWLEADRAALLTLPRVVWLPHDHDDESARRLCARWNQLPDLRACAINTFPARWETLDPSRRVVLPVHIPTTTRGRPRDLTDWLTWLSDPLESIERIVLPAALCDPAALRRVAPHLPPRPVTLHTGAPLPDELLTAALPLRVEAIQGQHLSQGQWLAPMLEHDHEALRTLELELGLLLDTPQRLPRRSPVSLHALRVKNWHTPGIGHPLGALLTTPQCASLRALIVSSPTVQTTVAPDIAKAPCARHLHTLGLAQCRLEREEIKLLGRRGLLHGERRLDLSYNKLNWRAVISLLAGGDWSAGFDVRLEHNPLGDRGVASLLSAWRVHPPEQLSLAKTNVRATQVNALLRSGALDQVRTLDLSQNDLDGLDVEALASLPHLRRLGLGHTKLSRGAALELLLAPWPALEQIQLNTRLGHIPESEQEQLFEGFRARGLHAKRQLSGLLPSFALTPPQREHREHHEPDI